MRSRNLIYAALIPLLTTVPAKAGLYISSEPMPGPFPVETKFFRDLLLNPLRGLVADKPSALRDRVKAQAERLRNLVQEGLATTEDRINLGGYLCWQRRYQEAIDVLKAASLAAPKNPFVLSNLATAYQGTGEYQQAYIHLDLALKNWPDRVPGWTQSQLKWLYRVEQFQLALLESRRQEQLRSLKATGLDPVFRGVMLDSPSRKFQPGELDPQTRRLLPPDATAVVQQLLVWMPQDDRVLWLYAELLNVQGEVEMAFYFMYLLRDAGFANAVFIEHRRILMAANEVLKEFTPKVRYEWLYRLSPRAGLGTPVDALAYEGARLEGLAQVRKMLDPTEGLAFPSPDDGKKVEPATTNTAPSDVLPNWKHIAIGFGAGVVVGVLLLLQLRQLFRRSPTRDRKPLRAGSVSDG